VPSEEGAATSASRLYSRLNDCGHRQADGFGLLSDEKEDIGGKLQRADFIPIPPRPPTLRAGLSALPDRRATALQRWPLTSAQSLRQDARHCLCERRRDRVSNLPQGGGLAARELKQIREALKPSRFTNRQKTRMHWVNPG
jgi:hypothetical protein